MGDDTLAGDVFYANYITTLTAQWQSLPSLSPNENLLNYSITPPIAVEIRYSQRDSQYYIRANETKKVIITFAIRTSPKTQPIVALPGAVQNLINHFSTFNEGALDLDHLKGYTGYDFLNAITSQKKGACRHRAVAFMAFMTQHYPQYPTRVIINEVHAFVEVQIEQQWVTCDLGGYPADLEIDEDPTPPPTWISEVLDRDTMPEDLKNQTPDVFQTRMKKALQTWTASTALSTLDPTMYYKACVSDTTKTRLIELPSLTAVNGLRFGVQAYCERQNLPVYYVHSPEDLICSAPSMVCDEEGLGTLIKGPSGPLHAFLTTHTKGVLIVNYVYFKLADFVLFNPLLDTSRKADGTAVPSELIILGLRDTSSPIKPGEDFYSRFDKVERCPLTESQLSNALPALPTTIPQPAYDAVINLYHAPDWKTRLLGRWIPKSGGWYYEASELVRLLHNAKSALTIEIQNGLWEDDDFCLFWQELQQKRSVSTPIGTMYLPEEWLVIQAEQGYDWVPLRPFIKPMDEFSSAPIVLNMSTLNQFFSRYEVHNERLEQVEGYLAATKASSIPVYVTHSLSDDAWAMLLTACQERGVLLKVLCAPGVSLPKEWGMELIVPYSIKATVIQSTDIDVTVAHCLKEKPQSIVIDVSECSVSDLISRVDCTLVNEEDKPLRLIFSETACAVQRALAEGKPVILKGKLSHALAETLAPLLFNEPDITLISEDTSSFSYIEPHQHVVSREEKEALLCERLGSIPDALSPFIGSEPFCTLLTRGRFMNRHPGIESDEAWVGLLKVTSIKKDTPFLLTEDTITTTNDFIKQRKDAVNAVLASEPYVFLTGLSGVGKSTFVMDALCEATDILYPDESHLLAWAKDNAPGTRKLLFIDEANLSKNAWSVFEGLFQTPQTILIQGQLYPLSEHHKVLFAGNPLNYGDERHCAPFFIRHGNAVLFNPLPEYVLYERILKPVVQGSRLEEYAEAIGVRVLQVYRFLCQCSTSDVLISPRELQMMALLTRSYCERHETAKAHEVAAYLAYHMAKPLVPKEKQRAYDEAFKTDFILTPSTLPQDTGYLITPSRSMASTWLEEFLNLREMRQKAEHPAVQYGGLGGIVLEGEPGIGKSELVMAALRAQHYQERNLTAPEPSEHYFYRMPASMPLSEKEALLRQAFHEGAVVVIDEMNSSPMMERLLNALLMGHTPEGQRPHKPGFMIIATQNPASMGGRRTMSAALNRRMMTVFLAPYTTLEMETILRQKGLNEVQAKGLASAFETQYHHAITHQLQPQPTFRDVLKEATRLMAQNEVAGKKRPRDVPNDGSENRFSESKRQRDYYDYGYKADHEDLPCSVPSLEEARCSSPTLFDAYTRLGFFKPNPYSSKVDNTERLPMESESEIDSWFNV